MIPITSLIFPVAFVIALLLPECELWLINGYSRDLPREALVDFAIGNGMNGGITSDACARLQGSAIAYGEDDDFDED